MNFLDRKPEMARLNSLMTGKEGGFGVVWGRRRIGKTRLLLEWCHAHKGLYTVADQSSAGVQRRYFAQAVAERFPGFDEAEYPDWRALLNRLSAEAAAKSWRGPIVIDELPYLVSACGELPSVLQRWIDHDMREKKFVVVVAGSSQRMMQGMVMDAMSPLYGRAAEIIEVKPLRAGYIAGALGLANAGEAVETYAAWGGTARYWELASKHGSDLDAAVDQLVLDPLSPLHAEPDRLLLEELPPAASLRPVLDSIGMGSHRLVEIAGRVGQPATSLGRVLIRLQELGLIARELPHGESEKSTKRSLYRISDPFFRLWFRVVAPHRALLADAAQRTRAKLWSGMKQSLFAETWEELCRQSLPFMTGKNSALSKMGPWEPGRRFWMGTGPEWDIVARSVDGKRLLLGEAKWCSLKASPEAARRAVGDLIGKGVFATGKTAGCEIVRAVFVPFASAPTKRIGDIHIVDAETVISCLM